MFSTEMVRAIREGRKRQTRRVVRGEHDCIDPIGKRPDVFWSYESDDFEQGEEIKCPHPPGSGIWVKEPCFTDDERQIAIYIADGTTHVAHYKKRPSLFMPRWAARTFLLVDSVKVERLQSISEEDAKAEGFDFREHFIRYWDVLNAKRGHGFDSDPWTWAYAFRPLTLEQATENGWRAGCSE